MKKLMFLGLAAAALFTSCSQNEVLDMNQQNAISFANSFVDNVTRVADGNDFSSSNKPASNVYGLMKIKGGQYVLAFDKQEVSNAGVYTPIQYWQGGADYWFTAFAPQNHAAWSFASATDANVSTSRGTLTFDNETAAGTADLVMAVSPFLGNVQVGENMNKVPLNFSHQLSRVKFEFQNRFQSSAYELQITNLKITNAIKSATMAVNNTESSSMAWDFVQDSNVFALNFPVQDTQSKFEQFGNNASFISEHMYVIPFKAENTLTIEFTVQVLQNGTVLQTYEYTGENAISIQHEMAKQHSYKFTTSLTEQDIDPNPENPDFQPIEFEISSEDWVEFN